MNFDLDQLKSLLNVAKDKGIEYAGVAREKTRDAAHYAKLRLDLTTEKEAQKKTFTEIGKAFFEEHRSEAEGLLAQLCAEIEAQNARIESIKAEMEDYRSSFSGKAESADFEEVVADAEDDITVEIVEEDDKTEEN